MSSWNKWAAACHPSRYPRKPDRELTNSLKWFYLSRSSRNFRWLNRKTRKALSLNRFLIPYGGPPRLCLSCKGRSIRAILPRRRLQPEKSKLWKISKKNAWNRQDRRSRLSQPGLKTCLMWENRSKFSPAQMKRARILPKKNTRDRKNVKRLSLKKDKSSSILS